MKRWIFSLVALSLCAHPLWAEPSRRHQLKIELSSQLESDLYRKVRSLLEVSPKAAAELTPKEKDEWGQLLAPLLKQIRQAKDPQR